MDQILDLVGEHRLVRSDNYLTTVKHLLDGLGRAPVCEGGRRANEPRL